VLGDGEFDGAGAGVPLAWAVSVAVVDAFVARSRPPVHHRVGVLLQRAFRRRPRTGIEDMRLLFGWVPVDNRTYDRA
jgi:hypothetical protein